jgi:hypothetical protein
MLIGRFSEGELYPEMEKFMNLDKDVNENEFENEFEKEIKELKEWQDNQFNPGYYIGTGRVPKPISSLSKHPVILIILGLICALPLPAVILSGNGLESLGGLLITAVIPVILILGGILRLIDKKKNCK